MVEESNSGDLDELYRETILEHSRSPHNRVSLSQADIQAEGEIPFCGDEVTVQILLDGESCIQKIGFGGKGCAISQASASMMTDLLAGKTLDQVTVLTELFRRMMLGQEVSPRELEELCDLKALLGVRKFPIRIKCALLPWTAVEEGIREHSSGSLR
ncbi:MAG: Fe-S cluster assembly sulfur transfer protein SufU [Anaerolineae bacterium]